MAPPAFPRSIVEFQRLFPDDDACRAYLFASRWPEGFRCPRCAGEAGVEQLQGTHRGVSRRHLQVYLDEFVFRHNRRRTPLAAFQTLPGLGALHQPSSYAQISQRREISQTEQTG